MGLGLRLVSENRGAPFCAARRAASITLTVLPDDDIRITNVRSFIKLWR